MSVVATFTDKFKGQLAGSVSLVRRRLFGANNERLDFFMDSFYKLSPNQRTGVLAGLVGVVVLFVLSSIGLYFAQMNRLRQDFNAASSARYELQSLKTAYEQENVNFRNLADQIDKKTKGQSLKPFFEKIANEQGVTIEGLTDAKSPLPTENPLAEKVQEVRVEMRMPNISIPRLLTFMVEIERSNKFLRVQDLTIRGRYGTKLYFDAQAKVRGYEAGGGP